MSDTFEIHIQAAGRWRIDSVFDDRELAIAAAKQAAKKPMIEAVRVVFEGWDGRAQKAVTRTIYRASRQQETINAGAERAKQKAAGERIEKRAANLLSGVDRQQIERKRRRASRNRFVAKMAVRIGALVMALAGGLYILRTLSSGQSLF